MKTELYRYRIRPGVLLTGKETEVRIDPLDREYEFNQAKEYRVAVWGLSRITRGDYATKNNIHAGQVKNGSLIFSHFFDREEECYIRVYEGDNKKHFLQLSVYALEEDLYSLRPLKGDFHVHTCRSDGQEPPAVVAASYRSAGFDFTAITDHYRYKPSVEAQQAYKDVPLGMLLVNGEEVHTPDNIVHVVNFGGESSVNELYKDDDEQYRQEVQKIIDTTDIGYEDKFTYAANLWAIEKIRAANGLAIFCHPHWLNDTFNVPPALSKAFLRAGEFDAFELIGGQSAHENNLQTALYYQIRSEGVNIPIVGASDSHGTINAGRLFDKMYTIVFAEENEKNSICDAVKDGRSVAVEVYADSVNYSVHGSFRNVCYARFLLENYFELTRQICSEEGLLMMKYLQGDQSAAKRLAELKTAVTDFYRSFFGR